MPTFALATALLLLPMAGCRTTHVSETTRYVLTTTLAGYHIHASLDRPATIESREDHALIAFGHHHLRVGKGRVVIDENVTAAFPITATQIVIEVSANTLSVTADRQEILKTPLPNE